jgi:hypothetical protein
MFDRSCRLPASRPGGCFDGNLNEGRSTAGFSYRSTYVFGIIMGSSVCSTNECTIGSALNPESRNSALTKKKQQQFVTAGGARGRLPRGYEDRLQNPPLGRDLTEWPDDLKA